MLIGHLYFFLGKCLSLLPIFQLRCLLLSYIICLISHIIGKYFLPFSRLSFCFFLMVSFAMQKLVSLIVFVQSPSHVWLFATPWTAAWQASLTLIISWSLPKFICIESMMPSNHFILCYPLPLILPSIQVFTSESAIRIRWPKYWSFSISPSKEYSGLISFEIDWFDLLAFQGTLETSPAPQIESINSLVLCLLYCPTLTSVHDCWKDHSLNYTDLRQQKQDLKLTVAQIISSS